MTTIDFIIIALASIGAHRLWNFEEIFAFARRWLSGWWWAKPITCRVCNAFWVAAAVVGLRSLANDRVDSLLLALALYAIVRSTLWLYARLDLTLPLPSVAAPLPAAAPVVHAVAPPPVTKPVAAAKTGCSSCERRAIDARANLDRAMTFESRVILLTALGAFPSSYSVATVVIDQARMLALNPKRLVQVWVLDSADVSGWPAQMPPNVDLRRIVPTVPWKDDVVDKEVVQKLVTGVREHLMSMGNATIITHDLLFISSFISFAAAIHELGSIRAFGWLHVCHSAAGKERPQGDALKYRATVPAKHRMLCLNPNDREHLAAYYDVPLDRISVATNARDVTSFGRIEPHAGNLISKHRLSEADVVQIFPVSGTRMGAKGMPTLLKILGRVAKLGMSVKLVVVNAHSNSIAVQHAIAAYKREADASGLGSENMVVTSEEFPGSAADGLPSTAVRDLFAVSNLFVMPSISEASSLVLLEAAMSGCLIVSNSSLHTLNGFVNPEWSLQAPFGSVRSPGDTSDHDAVAMEIVQLLRGSALNRCKRDILRRFNHRVVAEQLAAAVEATPPL